MQITEQQHKAAKETFELIATELGDNRDVHSATAISSAARLGGSFMFRSFNLQLENDSPGNVVLSEEANEKFPVLINFTAWMLDNSGLRVDEEQFDADSMTKSNLNLLETLTLLQKKAVVIMSENELDYEQMAFACAVTTAFLIKGCQRDLPVQSGFNTASYSYIEGCKTYPPELSNPAAKKRSIFTFWK